MLTRKTQYAWLSLGGLLCLFGLVLACRFRDGSRAVAQPELPTPSILTLPPNLPEKEPELLPPPTIVEKSKDQPPKEKPAELKATLEMPLPSDGPLVLPASFGPNTPTPPDTHNETVSGLRPATTPTSKTPEKKNEPGVPSWNAPAIVTPTGGAEAADHDSAKTQPGEPPLAPAPGPVQLYHVHGMETLHDIARRTLGSSDRWTDLHKLNPTLKPDEPLRPGAIVRLPVDACVQAEDVDPVKPLPVLRSRPPAPKAKVLPLTGTYQCSLDEKGQLTLPRAIRDQLGGSDTVLLSPGPDKCLWLTNQPHLERLGERLDQAQVNEADVRVFKRLYFAQTEKLSVNSDGRVLIPERLGQFAGLHQEVVLVGIDDHFEVWDAARWRSYTQQKSAGHSAAMNEQE